MSVADINGEAVALPRGGRCTAGRAARNYVDAANGGRGAALRTLKLLGFAGHVCFGLGVAEISKALDRNEFSVRGDLVDVQSALMLELQRLGITAEAVFPRRTAAFRDGEGI